MAKNTIKVRDYLHVVEEFPAQSAITPGMLVEITSDKEVKPHSVEGGAAPIMFANEDEFQGKTIEDAYAKGALVQCWLPQRGDIAYGILDDGEDVTTGDVLISAGNGKLKAQDSSEGTPIGIALESVDMTVSEPPSGRILVLIV